MHLQDPTNKEYKYTTAVSITQKLQIFCCDKCIVAYLYDLLYLLSFIIPFDISPLILSHF